MSDQTTTYYRERYDMDARGYGQGHVADCDGSFGQHWAVIRAELGFIGAGRGSSAR